MKKPKAFVDKTLVYKQNFKLALDKFNKTIKLNPEPYEPKCDTCIFKLKAIVGECYYCDKITIAESRFLGDD